MNAGYPVYGDQRYAPNENAGEQIRLWAYALTLTHPTQKEPMTFFSAPPWSENAFSAQIALLPAFSVCRGVYLDERCVVLDKHAGVEDGGRTAGRAGVAFRDRVPRAPAGREHRGDRAVRADGEDAEQYERLFFTHELRKIYHAVVRGVPKEEGRLVHWVKKDADASFVRLCREGDAGAQRCELSYRVLGAAMMRALSRSSSSRAHAPDPRADGGHRPPRAGDDKYGDREFNKRRRKKIQQLLAKRLEIAGMCLRACGSWSCNRVAIHASEVSGRRHKFSQDCENLMNFDVSIARCNSYDPQAVKERAERRTRADRRPCLDKARHENRRQGKPHDARETGKGGVRSSAGRRRALRTADRERRERRSGGTVRAGRLPRLIFRRSMRQRACGMCFQPVRR